LRIVVFLYYSLPVICRRNKFKAVLTKLFPELLKDCWDIIPAKLAVALMAGR
jgi:hypothetical protein